jgi:hypothetical protein
MATELTDPPVPARRTRRSALAGSSMFRYLVLAATAASSCVLVAWAPRHSPAAVALVVASTIGCGAVTVLERRAPRLGVRPIAVAIAIVFAVAVTVPPRTSNDLWSYTMYGRIVTAHHASPYATVPADFPSDPFLPRVSSLWRHRGSVFGPVWVGVESLDTSLSGAAPLPNRLFFQLGAALAAVAALGIVWRRTRSPVALAWLGLHPVFGAVAVNGGHNDLYVGLAILIAAILCEKRRGWSAGFVLGVAALVKLTALLGLAGVLIWAWRRRDRRLAWTASVATAVTLIVGYLPFADDAAHVLSNADRTVTPASLWNWPADVMLGHNAGRDFAHPLAPNTTLETLFYLSLALVAALALVTGWRAARGRSPAPVLGATTASYVFGAEYALPWYATWAMPVLADGAPSPLAWILWVQAAVMLAALKLPIRPTGTPLDTSARVVVTYLAPLVLLVAFVVAGTVLAHPRDRVSRSELQVVST